MHEVDAYENVDFVIKNIDVLMKVAMFKEYYPLVRC